MSPARTLGLALVAIGCPRDERGVGDRLAEARAEDGRFISWVEHGDVCLSAGAATSPWLLGRRGTFPSEDFPCT